LVFLYTTSVSLAGLSGEIRNGYLQNTKQEYCHRHVPVGMALTVSLFKNKCFFNFCPFHYKRICHLIKPRLRYSESVTPYSLADCLSRYQVPSKTFYESTKLHSIFYYFRRISLGKLLTVSHIHSHILFFLIKERRVPGVFLTRFWPQLNGGICSFHTFASYKKYFPLTNANTTINSSQNSLAGANA
jgi:hypothetical protein